MNSPASRRVVIRDLVLPVVIGVREDEKHRPQRVRINVELHVDDTPVVADAVDEVVSYADVVDGIKAMAGAGHVHLVETFAERIADVCLRDRRVTRVVVGVEKPDIIPEAAGVGVIIERTR